MTTKQIVVVPRSTITVKGPDKKDVVIKDPIEVDRFFLNIVREINELRADFVSTGGDMDASVYDPTSVEDDAFDMDNMADGSTNKYITGTQETHFETGYSHSQVAHAPSNADNTAANETSHADLMTESQGYFFGMVL
jgi:hypothetical protein